MTLMQIRALFRENQKSPGAKSYYADPIRYIAARCLRSKSAASPRDCQTPTCAAAEKSLLGRREEACLYFRPIFFELANILSLLFIVWVRLACFSCSI